MEKNEILIQALEGRIQEVMHYQINIDNYTIALKKIAELSIEEQQELSAFAEQLRGLLKSEIFEQKKAKIMLSVIEEQLK